MATRAQKTKVGVFVLTCLTLTAVGIALISGYRRGELYHYQVRFDESVMGLSVGGSVLYLGVPVGAVKDISVTADNKALVDIEVDAHKVTLYRGVKAQLVYYSFATGALSILLSGGDPNDTPFPVDAMIPSEASLVKSMSEQLAGLLSSLERIAATVSTQLEGLTDGGLRELVQEAHGVVQEARVTIVSTRERLEVALDMAPAAMDSITTAAKRVGTSADNIGDAAGVVKDKTTELDVATLNAKMDALMTGANGLISKLDTVAGTLDTATKTVTYQTDDTAQKLRETLHILNETLAGVRGLAEYLKDDPSSLLRGKGRAKGE